MKSALVIGASRGIGRQICLTLAGAGYNVGIASKTVEDSEKLPGTIYSVAEEVSGLGKKGIPIVCNTRVENDVNSAVAKCVEEFGGIDFLVYNAGAALWQKVLDTPMKRFDLLQEVNVRGAYAAVLATAPGMLERKRGKILLVAPPIYSSFFKGKTPYSIGKVGMTVLVMGFANELENTGVAISALWPATAIDAHVTRHLNVPNNVLRKPTIFADACLRIAEAEPESVNGLALIDEDYLRSHGVTDFSQYRCQPDSEPPRMMPQKFPSLAVEGARFQ